MRILVDRVKIETLMQERGWTITKFARKIGMRYESVYRILEHQRGAGGVFWRGLAGLGIENPFSYALSMPNGNGGCHKGKEETA